MLEGVEPPLAPPLVLDYYFSLEQNLSSVFLGYERQFHLIITPNYLGHFSDA